MARLPSTRYLIQQIGGSVILFEDYTEREIVKFDPASQGDTARAQKVIHDDPQMSDEDKCFAHLWCGYFYAYAGRMDPASHIEGLLSEAVREAEEADTVNVRKRLDAVAGAYRKALDGFALAFPS